MNILNHIFLTEIKRVYRDSWIIVVSAITCGLILFALHNGKNHTGQRSGEIERALKTQQDDDLATIARLDSVGKGLLTSLRPWLNPESPSYIANRKARVAAFPPSALGLIAVGQSDIYGFYTRPTFSGESYMLSFTELSNPVQLLFGSFDLSFVLVYLLPLVVLAFCYNLLSEEKERGSFVLVASQPVSVFRWLLTRLAARMGLLLAVVVAGILIGLAANGLGQTRAADVVTLLVAVIIYALFWAFLALVINYFTSSSGANALRLVSAWVVLALMLPSVIHQLAGALFPTPSRAIMINEVRVAKADASKEADAILASYYRDHPELAPKDTAQSNPYSYWISYVAAQELIKKQLEPAIARFEEKLGRQQSWVDRLRFVSPALLMQNTLQHLAGSSGRHYAGYREQVKAFSEEWKAYFVPKFFAGQKMTEADIKGLPEFTYQPDMSTPYTADLLGLLGFSLLLLAVAVWVYRDIYSHSLLVS